MGLSKTILNRKPGKGSGPVHKTLFQSIENVSGQIKISGQIFSFTTHRLLADKKIQQMGPDNGKVRTDINGADARFLSQPDTDLPGYQ